jgi:pimeloyl-ACP methyl ester carboxylesterase
MAMSGLTEIGKGNQSTAPMPPCLFMVGEHDIELAINTAKEWHERLPNSEFIQVPGAGHSVNLDQPEEFNQIVLNFLTNIDKEI